MTAYVVLAVVVAVPFLTGAGLAVWFRWRSRRPVGLVMGDRWMEDHGTWDGHLWWGKR